MKNLVTSVFNFIPGVTILRKATLAARVKEYMDNSQYSKHTEATLRRRFPLLTDENIDQVMLDIGAVRYTRYSDDAPMWG